MLNESPDKEILNPPHLPRFEEHLKIIYPNLILNYMFHYFYHIVLEFDLNQAL